MSIGTIPALVISNPFDKLPRKEGKKMAKKKKKGSRISVSASKMKKRSTPKKSGHKKRSKGSRITVAPQPYDLSAFTGTAHKKTTPKKARKNTMAKKGHKGHRKHKNPMAMTVKGVAGSGKRLLVDGALVTGGFIGMSFIENMIPAQFISNDYVKLAVKSGITIATGMLLSKVKATKNVAEQLAIGMAVNTIIDAMNVFGVTKFLPAPKMVSAPATTTTSTSTGTGVMVNQSGLGVMLNKSSL